MSNSKHQRQLDSLTKGSNEGKDKEREFNICIYVSSYNRANITKLKEQQKRKPILEY
jgi:hypothetical protein